MECFIFKEGVEKKAGLEDMLPLMDDRLIQFIFIKAYNKTSALSYALAYMPDKIKEMVYRNLPLRIQANLKEDVNRLETAHESDLSYIEDRRTELISFIGENSEVRFGSPDCFIWKQTEPEEETRDNPIEELIKEIEYACASGKLHFTPYHTGILLKEDPKNVFAAFHDRKSELQKIRSLGISAELLPAASLIFGNGALDTLYIYDELTGTWPEFMKNCGTLTSIKLSVEGLTEFPSWIRNAVSLRKLDISEIISIPDWIGDLQSLTEIRIHEIKTLPDSIGNLRNLAKLTVKFSDIDKLTDSIGNLCSLKELELGINKNLTSLPDSIGNLTNLNKLRIYSSAIEKLPDSIGNLCSLKELELDYNENLASLPDSIGNLKDLEKLNLSYLTVKTLPRSVGNLQNLAKLSLDESKIEKLPESIGNLEKLTELSLENCKKIKCLPDSIGKLKNLASLNLYGSSIEILPDTLADCPFLECVDVRDTGVTSFPNFISPNIYIMQSIKLIPEKRGISYLSFCNHYYNLVETIFRFSYKARSEGLLALEDELKPISEGFLKTGLRLMVDGTDGAIIRKLLTLKIEREYDYYIKKLKETALEGIMSIQNGDGLPRLCLSLASIVDIKDNPLKTACAKHLDGDDEAFYNIDFKAALQPEGEREEIRFIKRAFEISEMARNSWLEVEKHLDNDGIAAKDVFEYGLPMLIEDWDYEDIDKSLSYLISLETDPVRKNLALAKKDAVRMIYEGYNSRVLLLMLSAYFDDDVAQECLSELG